MSTTTTTAEDSDVPVPVNKSRVMTLLCRHTGTVIDECSPVIPDSSFELEATAQGVYHVRWRFNAQAIELISIVTSDSSLHTDKLVVAAFSELAKEAGLRLIVVRVLSERSTYWKKLGFTPCDAPPGAYAKAL